MDGADRTGLLSAATGRIVAVNPKADYAARDAEMAGGLDCIVAA